MGAKEKIRRFDLVKLALLIPLLFKPGVAPAQESIKVGSKLFTESVILGEIISQRIKAEGYEAEFFEQLGGTRILWNALLEKEIDIYPEYTGTVIQEILSGADISTHEQLNTALSEYGLKATKPLGFNNTYAMGMLSSTAEELSISKISDLQDHKNLSLGFSNEFIDRADGWKGLKEAYQLDHKNVTGLDHDLAYRGLEAKDIDVIDLYSTDAEISYYNIEVLDDDRGFFPRYEAVLLYRSELEELYPELISALTQLEGKISEQDMVAMNAAVKLEGTPDEQVASNFLDKASGIKSEVKAESFWKRLLDTTTQHLYLVGISLALAILLAVPLGVIAAKFTETERAILATVGILQTIPSLALLVFMIPLLGIGAVPAMAALFLYSLLPVVRNTHAGIKGISPPVKESALALGLPASVVLRKIELPLALPTILAGIKTAAVINVGTATLGALIGAGGYGQPILTGIRLDSVPLILEGAIPAALLALLVQGVFDLAERLYVKHQ